MNETIGKGPALPPAISANAGNTVRIPSTQILPQTSAPMSIGDLLRFHVRSNPPGELGTLYYQGQLIKTMLPSNVSTGDKLLARLESSGEQVVFKILELIKSDGSTAISRSDAAISSSSSPTPTRSQTEAPLQELSKQIESILQRTAPQTDSDASQAQLNPLARGLTTAATPLAIEEPLKSGELQKLVETISKTIGSGENLQNAKSVGESIRLSSSGSAPEILRQAAEAIKLVLKETPYQLPTTDRFLVLLQNQLSSLLDSSQTGAGREMSLKQVDILLRAVGEELKNQKGGESGKASDALKLVLTDLKLARQEPAALEKHIESALNRVYSHLGESPETEGEKRVNPKLVSDLRTLVNRLESLAQTHETLAALNPVMNALGEPALILFPFILHGLLHHSEITIDPNAGRHHGEKNAKGNRRDGEDAYQRIQVRLPLPNLGPLEVDIAHRDTEVLTRVITRDPQTAAFLLEQSENLRLSLQTAHFELVDYSTSHSSAIGSSEPKEEIA